MSKNASGGVIVYTALSADGKERIVGNIDFTGSIKSIDEYKSIVSEIKKNYNHKTWLS